jgi:hypothetical protein
VLGLCDVVFLFLADVLYLILVALLELALHHGRVLLELLNLSQVSRNLLVLLINQRLNAPAALKELLLVLLYISLQVLLLHATRTKLSCWVLTDLSRCAPSQSAPGLC